MTVSGFSLVPGPQERVYAMLQDPDVLAKCMPGCDHLEKVGPDSYEMKMKMAIASVSGLFDGKVKIANQHPPESFRLTVDGTGKIGFLKGEGDLKLTPNGDSTQVFYEGNVQVGGMIASMGQRLLESTSKMIIRRFFEKLSELARAQAG